MCLSAGKTVSSSFKRISATDIISAPTKRLFSLDKSRDRKPTDAVPRRASPAARSGCIADVVRHRMLGVAMTLSCSAASDRPPGRAAHARTDYTLAGPPALPLTIEPATCRYACHRSAPGRPRQPARGIARPTRARRRPSR